MSFAAFSNKRLCDVVFPGTHDAGIYGDLGRTVKTQNRNILEQAKAGVRWFDLRIITVETQHGPKDVAYHGSFKGKGEATQKMNFGGTAKEDDLTQVLRQARDFVITNADDFLILRFSKCGNMEKVVQTCSAVLNDKMLRQNLNLNTAPIATLQGHVIVVVDKDDFNKLPTLLKARTPGILCCNSLFTKARTQPNYDPNFWGLQYYGKYSNTRSLKKNLKSQTKNMAALGGSTAPELLGMIYWTLTTQIGHLSESIEKRDNRMWRKKASLSKAWESGVKDHIIARIGHKLNQLQNMPLHAAGMTAESFIPNIVMLDFADPDRCATIWNLNLKNVDIMNAMADDLRTMGV